MCKRLGYNRDEVLAFNCKRCCGLWFLAIGAVIILATIWGGDRMVNPFVFAIGFAIGFYISHLNKAIYAKLSQGPQSAFQGRIAFLGILSLFVLMFLLGGPFFPGMNWRMIWLGAFLATGLHFFIFYFVHGKSMLFIGALCTLCALAGMAFKNIPFIVIGVLDGAIKVCFAVYLLFFSKPSTNR